MCPPLDETVLFANGALTDGEYDDLRRQQKDFNERFAISNATLSQLSQRLDRALKKYQSSVASSASDD